MGVLDRMGRAISERFDALLDGADDPRRSIEQTLREMEAQLRAAQREVVRGVAAAKQLERRAEELIREVERWQGRAELALKHNDDDLAREALRHRRRVEAERSRVEGFGREQRGFAVETKREVERMEAKLQELRAKQGTLAVQVRQARAGGGAEALGAKGATATPFESFRRLEDQIEGVETAFEAQREVDQALAGGAGPGGMTRDEVEARFQALEGSASGGTAAGGARDDLDAELEALRQRVRIKT